MESFEIFIKYVKHKKEKFKDIVLLQLSKLGKKFINFFSSVTQLMRQRRNYLAQL